MSNTYTNLPNLSLGNNGADVVTLSSSGLSVTSMSSSGAISGTNVTASGYLATSVAAATPAASITALSSAKAFYRMNSTIAVNILGITAGVDGQRLDLYFKSASNLTITSQSTAAAATARIVLMTTAATAVTTASGFASFIYSSDDSRWLLKALTT